MAGARTSFHSIPFLSGGGELGALIAAFDWSATALGPIEQWPAHVRIATATMLRSAVPIVMLWGEQGVMIYNQAYSVFAGLRHPQLLGSEVRKGWPEVADFNDNVMKVGLAGGTLNYQDQELTLNRRNKSEQVWMNLDYSPLLDEEGRPAGVMAIVVETTDKVRALQLLNSESERMAQLFQQAPSFMTMLQGPSHRFTMANPNYLRLVGRPVVGKTVEEALPEAQGQGFVKLLDRVYASGEPFLATGLKYTRHPEPGRPGEDRYLDFVYQPVRNAAGEVDGIFVEGVDVTERVQAERRRERMVWLAESMADARTPSDVGYAAAAMLGEALEVSRVGYGSIDPDTDTLHVERDWCAPGVDTLAGVTHLRDYGSFIDSLKRNEFIAIPDVREDDRTRPAAAALEARFARSFVNVPVHEHGRLVAVFFVNNGQERAWTSEELAFIRDVGQRTRMASERVRSDMALRASEARLREANETLEAKVADRTRALMEIEAQYRQSQKMEAIGQLTGGIAHDFNNLLHSMSMSLEILKRSLQAGRTDNWEKYLDVSQTSVRRAASLTHRLLAFSRRQTLDPQPTEVGQLLRAMEELIRGTVGPAIAVHIEVQDGLWMTRVDASQLENAVLNLCINARDAMPHGGSLDLHATNAAYQGDDAAAGDLAPGDYVLLTVRDTGTGMPPEVASRAFDPFFTTKAQGQGTGLGLSMVYGFVRQSDGQVQIDSAPGRGTAMHIYLPRYRGERQDQRAATPAVNSTRAKGEIVLLVEDERPIRELLREELQSRGFQVLAVATGAEALAILGSPQRVDVLVSDVGLPGGMNGRQVAEQARKHRPGLKVLFITGYAEGKALGDQPAGTRVVTKPFETADLMVALWALLGTPLPQDTRQPPTTPLQVQGA